MNAPYIITQLQNNIPLFREIFNNIPEELIHWRNQPEKWNLLEIVCHLYDEEREDFRARLKHVLENPSGPLPSIDPAGWVLSRNYASKNYHEVLNSFLKERQDSVNWLLSLKNPIYENAFQHPKFGPMTGKLFLSNWLAHDYLHMRQILRIKYDFLSFTSGERLDYAGNW